MPYWVWPILLLVICFLLGIVAVLGGVGGGVLFVPIVSSFFPFHLDFVRCAGLLVALSTAISAGPRLLRDGLANLRLTIPVALVASTCTIVGARIGLAMPERAVQVLLGVTILGVTGVMLYARRSDHPDVPRSDALSRALGIYGFYHERSTGQAVQWRIHRTPLGLALFMLVGLVGGMFGLGAGWANVPVLNLVMGAPLKLSVASSNVILVAAGSSGAWVYLHSGAVLSLVIVPSVFGMMLGARVGVRVLLRVRPKGVRVVVLAVLLLGGLRSLTKGLGL